MHRQSSRPAGGTFLGPAAAAIALATSCTPNQGVKPGAPVLAEVVIIENGMTASAIHAGATDCDAALTAGSACDPVNDTSCHVPSGNNWCRCDAMSSMWKCDPFSPISTVDFVFDRVLDSTPLDPGDAGGGISGISTSMFAPAAASTIATSVDYVANGSPKEVIFPLLGDLRTDGPNLLVTPSPTLPAAVPGGTAVTIGLDKTKVLAKDGKTPFASPAPFADGSFTFMVASFSATFTSQPTPPTDDAGTMGTEVPPDMTPVVVAFNNLVDQTLIPNHITATSVPAGSTTTTPATVPVSVTTMDGLSYSIVPNNNNNWPASSTITVTVDATAADLAGDQLGASVPAPAKFTTSAN
jgi:hypothetical protein